MAYKNWTRNQKLTLCGIIISLVLGLITIGLNYLLSQTKPAAKANIQNSALTQSPVITDSPNAIVNYLKPTPRQLNESFKSGLRNKLQNYPGYFLEVSYALNNMEAKNLALQVQTFLTQEGWEVDPEIYASVFEADSPAHFGFEAHPESKVLTISVLPQQ